MQLTENVKLSITQIAQLTGIVLERAQPRSADKPKAVAKFCSALEERMAEESGIVIEKVLSAPNCDDALRLLKTELVKHDRKQGKQTARLEASDIIGDRRPDTTTQTSKESNVLDNNTEESKSARGRKSDLIGKKLTCLKESNPRREGSHGYKSLQIIIDNPGITTEAFAEAGGRLVDLKWDLAHGNAKAE